MPIMQHDHDFVFGLFLTPYFCSPLSALLSCDLGVMGFPMGVDEEDHNQQQNRVFYELCEMIIHILGSTPFPIPFPALFGPSSVIVSSSRVSPAAFASLFLGISIALMLFGSVIFVIGLILMPWVIALVFLFYFAAILSSLSQLGLAFLPPPLLQGVETLMKP